MTGPVKPEAVLAFWLEEITPEGWYLGTPEVDARCQAAFGPAVAAAQAGAFRDWLSGPETALAYFILTDQLPRNIYRGQAAAFASDSLAQSAARLALDKGWDLAIPAPQRQFFYMPFEHAENEADQALSVQLFTTRLPGLAEHLLHARAHQAVIARFGRFPSRNAALGRPSTAEETAWLAAGGYPAEVARLSP